MQVEGRSADLASSYFLDREFWIGVQRYYPEGVVAAVPQRGGLVYAPVSDDAAPLTDANPSGAELSKAAGGDVADEADEDEQPKP